MNALLLVLGVLVLGAAIVFATLTFYGPVVSASSTKWRTYSRWVDVELKSLYSPMRVRSFVIRQAAGGAAGLLLGILLGSPFLGVLLLVGGAYLPVYGLKRDRVKRRLALDAQLDTVLQSLANTILVTQNLEDAFETIAHQFDAPISQEADVVVKQVRLGMPMDQALHDLATRTQSRNIDALVTALTIGRQTGGELPRVLENTAAVLRETIRVEGVMAAKTSEGKAQGVVMGLLPFVFGAAVQFVAPEWMRPLFQDPIGWAILAVACVFEIIGVSLIRHYSRVDV